jgi:tRNA-specific 2-thiouridylase
LRVVVAMSGGVDSAVAAALSARDGNEVIGVTLQLADLSARGLGVSRCCSPDDVEMARRVCWALDVPHYVLNMEASFQSAVLAPFVDSYLSGETPLPCALCNSRIKFGELAKAASLFDADVIATGHYARLERGRDGMVVLLRGLDRRRDQSYFLFRLTRDQLERTSFPLGELEKGEVRRIAAGLGLPNAGRADSQEVCFVPERSSYVDVLERLAGERLPAGGTIVDTGGRKLGTHGGVHLFTVGQRRGIGLPSRHRLYVVALDPAAGTVVVGGREEAMRREVAMRDVSWLADDVETPVRALVQVRSRHHAQAATVTRTGEGGTITFDEPVLAPAPGQAAVCYLGERLLGGGWISSSS